MTDPGDYDGWTISIDAQWAEGDGSDSDGGHDGAPSRQYFFDEHHCLFDSALRTTRRH
jgi:hypothetical protein